MRSDGGACSYGCAFDPRPVPVLQVANAERWAAILSDNTVIDSSRGHRSSLLVREHRPDAMDTATLAVVRE